MLCLCCLIGQRAAYGESISPCLPLKVHNKFSIKCSICISELGLTGVPIFNTNNNCSSGSSALMLARHLVQSGVYDCVLALGFEKMEQGLSERYTDRTSPVQRHRETLVEMGADGHPVSPKMNNMTSDVIKVWISANTIHPLDREKMLPRARNKVMLVIKCVSTF